MVREAKVKQAAAEKRFKEANNKVSVLSHVRMQGNEGWTGLDFPSEST